MTSPIGDCIYCYTHRRESLMSVSPDNNASWRKLCLKQGTASKCGGAGTGEGIQRTVAKEHVRFSGRGAIRQVHRFRLSTAHDAYVDQRPADLMSTN